VAGDDRPVDGRTCPEIAMKRLAATATLLAALAVPPAARAAESGLVIFHTQCSRCHGADGRGSAVFTTPNMRESKLSAAEMAKVVADGRGKMPSFKLKLTAEEIEAVAGYVKRDLPR
jgi:mono/diheme cytochrome c family protein